MAGNDDTPLPFRLLSDARLDLSYARHLLESGPADPAGRMLSRAAATLAELDQWLAEGSIIRPRRVNDG